MNDQTRLDRIIALIKGAIKKLINKIKGKSPEKKPLVKDAGALQEAFKRALAGIKGLGKTFRTKKLPRVRRSKHAGSKNKNKKRNKVRAKMAVESNRINRIRVKRWKH